jgi:hypothetical protein
MEVIIAFSHSKGIPWLVSRAGAPKIIAVASYGYPLV